MGYGEMGDEEKAGTKLKAGSSGQPPRRARKSPFPIPHSPFPLFGHTRFSVLSRLLISPDRRYYQQQLIDHAGTGQGAVQRELAQLAAAEIILRVREGRQIYFQANARHPFFPELRGLAIKGTSVDAVIAQSLEQLAPEIDLAMIYGGAARATPGRLGDIELLIIAPLAYSDVANALFDLQKYWQREVRQTIIPMREFRTRLRAHDPFLIGVMRGPRKLLIGSDKVLDLS
ncbi:hypothetical protein BH09SUM1_BH09SUM1_30080 [soil metagenome]